MPSSGLDTTVYDCDGETGAWQASLRYRRRRANRPLEPVTIALWLVTLHRKQMERLHPFEFTRHSTTQEVATGRQDRRESRTPGIEDGIEETRKEKAGIEDTP